MATEAQIRANQQNAMRSTGPITPGGKEQSRRNALKHGLTGAGIVLPEVKRRATAFAEELEGVEPGPEGVFGARGGGQGPLAGRSAPGPAGSKGSFAPICPRRRVFRGAVRDRKGALKQFQAHVDLAKNRPPRHSPEASGPGAPGRS